MSTRRAPVQGILSQSYLQSLAYPLNQDLKYIIVQTTEKEVGLVKAEMKFKKKFELQLLTQ